MPAGWEGVYHPSPSSFTEDMTFTLDTPNAVLAERMRNLPSVIEHCAPRPGPLAETAEISITSDAKGGMAIAVATEPKNRATDKCIETSIQPYAQPFKRVKRLSYRDQIALVRVTPSRIHESMLRHAGGFATDCYDKESAPVNVTIAVAAKPDDTSFNVSTDAKDETFGRCLVDKLAVALRDDFTVAGYFRIDKAIDTALTIPVETPQERLVRIKRLRDEMEKQRRAMEQRRDQQINRRQLGF
jgi:hypothetical protein